MVRATGISIFRPSSTAFSHFYVDEVGGHSTHKEREKTEGEVRNFEKNSKCLGSPINDTMQRETSPFEKLSETNLYIRGLSADVSDFFILRQSNVRALFLTIQFRQQTWTCRRCARSLAQSYRQKQ